jgi:hypothetical protein
VRAVKHRFKETVRTGIRLVVGQDATVDLQLVIGEVSQQVTVSGDGPTLTTTQDVSGLVGERQIVSLPLNGHSQDELLTLNPAW